MSSNDKESFCLRVLRKKHTGKLISILNTAIYSLVSYFAISALKRLITSTDAKEQSIGIILLLLFVGALGWARDLITDTADMQSPANKERDDHKKTKTALNKSEADLAECRRIIHAIRSNITNTIMQEPSDEDKIQKIIGMMVKINKDSSVNNVTEASGGDIQKDYLSLFSADNL